MLLVIVVRQASDGKLEGVLNLDLAALNRLHGVWDAWDFVNEAMSDDGVNVFRGGHTEGHSARIEVGSCDRIASDLSPCEEMSAALLLEGRVFRVFLQLGEAYPKTFILAVRQWSPFHLPAFVVTLDGIFPRLEKVSAWLEL